MKKSFVTSLVATLLLSVSLPAGAANITKEDIDKKLIEKGLDSSIVELMPKTDKDEIYKSLIEDPEKVQITSSYMTVDNLSFIEYYTNTDDQELLENGITKEDIKRIRGSLKQLENSSFDELNKKVKIDKFEYKLLKEALKKNPNYKKQDTPKNKQATASGQISTSDLAFDMVVTDETESYPLYSVYIYYNWSSPYFNDIYDDKVAVAWGGSFNTKNVSSQADYYYGNYYTGKFSDKYDSFTMNTSQSPNTGIIFSTPQSKKFATTQNKFGTMNFDIYRNSSENESTKIVSQYAHAITTIGGVTISNAPGIAIGSGYHYSPQRGVNITN